MRYSLFPIAAMALFATAAADPAGFISVVPDQLLWRELPDSHGVASAVVAGDPSKPGIYVVRVRFPPHVMDRPHSHSGDRYVTVLEGTWYAGTGPNFNPAAATPMPTGSYMFHPARGVHWDGSNSDKAAVVQIVGRGPVTSADVNPSLPSWVKVTR